MYPKVHWRCGSGKSAILATKSFKIHHNLLKRGERLKNFLTLPHFRARLFIDADAGA
jgi:hypothetical protein